MRFFVSFLFALLLIGAGVSAVVRSSDQGAWIMSKLATLDPGSSAPAKAPEGGPPLVMAQATQPQAAPPQATPPQTAPPQAGQPAPSPGKPFGDWLLVCADNPETSAKQCSIRQQVADQKSKSVVFAWIIGNDEGGNLKAVWRTPTGILVNRGVVIDVGTEKPIAVPYTACVTSHCEAVANLAPDFVETLMKAEKATATIFAISGQGLTFVLSVKGLSDGLTALRKETAER